VQAAGRGDPQDRVRELPPAQLVIDRFGTVPAYQL
jgi:hypothetical protein